MPRLEIAAGPRGYRIRVDSTRPRGGAFDRVEAIDLYAGIRRLIEDGKSDMKVAEAVGVSDRTVRRYRVRHDIPNIYGVRPSDRQATMDSETPR